MSRVHVEQCVRFGAFQISLIIHEENTKKISTMLETLYVIKFCSKFLLDFYNVDLQNNYAIELMK